MIHIDLKNVGIIREAHLGFVPGVNLILGASSSGKSTQLYRCDGHARAGRDADRYPDKRCTCDVHS